MSRKTHYKARGASYISAGKSGFTHKGGSVCGFVYVTVTKNKQEVDCKLCLKAIDDADHSDDVNYDNTM